VVERNFLCAVSFGFDLQRIAAGETCQALNKLDLSLPAELPQPLDQLFYNAGFEGAYFLYVDLWFWEVDAAIS